MLQLLAAIPHPTWRELFISAQVFLCLYPIRVLGKLAEYAVGKERKHIIERHVTNGHMSHLKTCQTDDCIKLSTEKTQLEQSQQQDLLQLLV